MKWIRLGVGVRKSAEEALRALIKSHGTERAQALGNERGVISLSTSTLRPGETATLSRNDGKKATIKRTRAGW